MAERSEFAAVRRERTAAWSRTADLMCGDWSHAEDLVQAALLRLYLKWPRINLDGLDAYARRTILRLAIDESRRPHRRIEVSRAFHGSPRPRDFNSPTHCGQQYRPTSPSSRTTTGGSDSRVGRRG